MSVVDSFDEGHAVQIDHRVSSYRVSYILHAEIIEFWDHMILFLKIKQRPNPTYICILIVYIIYYEE